jgi:formylglycine-generating enzyme required for sulfatase activity
MRSLTIARATIVGAAAAAALAIVSLSSPEASAQAPSASAAPATATTPAPASCPAGMAAIPGGTYAPGGRKDAVVVAGYCLDLTEVTVAAYDACVTSGACTPPDAYEAYDAKRANWQRASCNWRHPGRAQHPINCVDSDQSAAFCASLGKRLPTEEEWEWAARSGPDAAPYPWGSATPDEHRLNACGLECRAAQAAQGVESRALAYRANDGFAETAPVGSFPQGDNRWGVHDLEGNVAEWTSTAWRNSHLGQADTIDRVTRGAGWLEDHASGLTATARDTWTPATRFMTVGFRCLK